ncbi:MAG: hypothetical protein WC460_01410 [Patescibacteria group bacterium]
MKGIYMPTPEYSREIKPKIHSMQPIESEQLAKIGSEIEEELTAKEKAELKAKQSPKEQIANFYTTDEWANWKNLQESSKESTEKIVARNGLLMELDALEKQVSNDPESLKAIALIREELTAGHA